MFWLRTPCGASDGERLADAAAVRRGRSGRRRMSEVSRRRRSSRSRFDAAGHQGPASNLRGNPSRCQSRSRTRADSASLATAEAMAALIAYAAAPRSWAATWATATACRPQGRRTSPGRAVHVRRHSPRKRRGAHHACAPRRGFRNDRVDSVTRTGVARLLLLERCRTCSAQRAAHSASRRWCSPVNVPPRRLVISRGSRSAGRIGMSSVLLSSRADRHVQSLTTHRRNGPIDHP